MQSVFDASLFASLFVRPKMTVIGASLYSIMELERGLIMPWTQLKG